VLAILLMLATLMLAIFAWIAPVALVFYRSADSLVVRMPMVMPKSKSTFPENKK
jgi:hypothetical protein